jgi:hypothetical protein
VGVKMSDRGTIAFIGGAAFLVMLSAIAATISIIQRGFGADGAAWVQATGSIAAIAGAVWLSRSEATLRRRERRAMGEEIAWAVRFALTNAQLEARTIAAELVDEHLLEGENPECHWLLRSENCRNVLKVYAERTDHLHPALNHIASNGMLLLRQMDEDLRQASKFIERQEHPSLAVATRIAWYEAHFQTLLDLLDARMRGILKALDKSRDTLPARTLEAWEAPDDSLVPEPTSRGGGQ